MRWLAVALVMTMAAGAAAAMPAWPDDPRTRLAALALLETLNADLLSHDSATLTLDRWCAAHGLAQPAKVTAERVRGQDLAPTPEQRQALRVQADEAVGYRRVRLRCGDLVLSEADNWYVPARLTDEMNRTLATTDTAFGRAVQALHFTRHTEAAELLWQPLPEGWERGAAFPQAGGDLDIPPLLLRHEAVLSLPDGTPFSLVIETYTRNVLAFPPP